MNGQTPHNGGATMAASEFVSLTSERMCRIFLFSSVQNANRPRHQQNPAVYEEHS